jgi:rare lipoprotein A
MERGGDLPSLSPGRMGAGVMLTAYSSSERAARPLRQIVLAACAACLPLSGLSASTEASAPAPASAPISVAASSSASASFGQAFAPIAPEPVLDIAASAPREARAIAGGSASYYAAKFEGRPTANGERYRAGELTAAHRSLPFGSKVRVTNPANGRSVTVRINDRGPFTAGRVIDVSRAAAQELGLIARGHAPVELAVIED